MREAAQPIYVRTFGVALYLHAKGFQPLRAELSREGLVGEVVFVFGPEAAGEMERYHASKEYLSKLAVEARRR